MANANIGMVLCPFTGKPAAVRMDKKGKFYMISPVGMVRPNMPAGQRYIQENATIWGEDKAPPADCPTWIAKGESWPREDPDDTPDPRPPAATAEPAAPAPGGLPDPAGDEPESTGSPDEPPADPEPADDDTDDGSPWTPFG